MEADFSEYARSYKLVLPLLSFYNEMIDKTVNVISDKNFILDIGSGPGMLNRKSVRKIISLDYAHSMLKDNGLLAMVADASNLPFGKGVYFEGIVGLNILPFIRDYNSFFNEITRVTQEGSILVLSGRKKDADDKRLEEQAKKDLGQYLNDTCMKEHILRVIEWNMHIEKKVVNNFTIDDVCKLIGGHQFEIIGSELIYLRQSYFVVARRV